MGFLTIFFTNIWSSNILLSPHLTLSSAILKKKKNYAGSYTPRSILGAVAVSRQPIRGEVR